MVVVALITDPAATQINIDQARLIARDHRLTGGAHPVILHAVIRRIPTTAQVTQAAALTSGMVQVVGLRLNPDRQHAHIHHVPHQHTVLQLVL